MQNMIAHSTSAIEDEGGEVSQLRLADSGEANLLPGKPEELLEDKHHAYHIVEVLAFTKFLSCLNPPQLRLRSPSTCPTDLDMANGARGSWM